MKVAVKGDLTTLEKRMEEKSNGTDKKKIRLKLANGAMLVVHVVKKSYSVTGVMRTTELELFNGMYLTLIHNVSRNSARVEGF